MNSADIELAVVRYFGIIGMQSRNIIIPNFKGFWLHECDLFIATPARWAYEVEIKVSLADLKADLKKRHGHYSDIIKGLYFAIPEELYGTFELNKFIPHRAGLLIIKNGKCRLCWRHQSNHARKLTEEEYMHLGAIACNRLWKLKGKK